MNLLQLFKDYLSSQSNRPSQVTLKNYVADIRKFITWYQTTLNKTFGLSAIELSEIEQYKQYLESASSARSQERYLSSLRKFFCFLETTQVQQDPLKNTKIEKKIEQDIWHIREFKDFLYRQGSSPLTIKNYIADIQALCKWVEKVSLQQEEYMINHSSPLASLTPQLLSEYKNRLLFTVHLSPATVNRKLSSARKFVEFCRVKGYISDNHFSVPQVSDTELSIDELTREADELSTGKNISEQLLAPYTKAEDILATTIAGILKKTDQSLNKEPLSFYSVDPLKKEFYAPHKISTSSLPFIKKLWHHIRFTRPLWYKMYHKHRLVHYVHFALLMIFASGAGFLLFHTFSKNTGAETKVLAAQDISRVLSYQGRLTDDFGRPITSNENIRFSIYRNKTASGSALLWQEVHNATPQEDGTFNVILGSKETMSNSLFDDNEELYLGITIGSSQELSPRERLATVEYASTAESIAGMLPITHSSNPTRNAVLALDGTGNLSIGGDSSPTFQALGGTFKLSGQTLVLSTNIGSNGNIELNPDGTGKIDLQKALINSSKFALEVADNFTVSASDSAQPALSVTNNTFGNLIEASSAGVTRFVLTGAGNVGIGVINPDHALEVGGDLKVIGNTNLNGVSYSWPTSVRDGYILSATSSGKLAWIAPSTLGGTLFKQENGSLFTSNSTTDVLFGGTSTGSAKFAFKNMIGAPVMSIGNNLSLDSEGKIYTTENKTLTLGSSSTGEIQLKPSGNTTQYMKFYTSDNVATIGTGGGSNLTLNPEGGLIGFGGTTHFISTAGDATLKTLLLKGSSFVSNALDIEGNIKLGSTDKTRWRIYTVGSSSTANTCDTATPGSVSALCFDSDDDPNTSEARLESNGDLHLAGKIYADDGLTLSANPDIAEEIIISDSTIEQGDILTASSEQVQTANTFYNVLASKTSKPYEYGMIGIVPENPSILLGTDTKIAAQKRTFAIAGRVFVKVSGMNGPIKAGDPITSSSLPGVGMKADKAGPIVGKALQDFNVVGAESQGKILVLVNLSWYDPSFAFNEHGDFSITESAGEYAVKDSRGNQAQTTGVFNKTFIASIQSGIIKSKRIITDQLEVGTVRIAGKTLSQYIDEKILNSKFLIHNSNFASPLAQIDQIETSIISPLGKEGEIALAVNSSDLSVKNTEKNEIVAQIDSDGNTSFSGDLSSKTIETSDANISGTLTADRIVANTIDGLEDKIRQLRSNEDSLLSSNASNLGYVDVSSISAQLALIDENLIALGTTTLNEATVFTTLTVGSTLKISSQSIDVIGTDLQLQPLRQGGVSFLSGKIRISAAGDLEVGENAYFSKDVEVKGKLSTNILSPLPENDLIVQLGENEKDTKNNLVVKDSTGSAVLSITQNGDLLASGAAHFSKLNFNVISKAYALSATEAVATGSAGIATLKGGRPELTIYNKLITEDSLIYITPTGNTKGSVLYLLRQLPQKSFTVGLDKISLEDIPFNWIIVN